MNWFKRPTHSIGSALFAGTTPPRPHEFPQLERGGFSLREGAPLDGAHWTLSLDHPAFGSAEVACARGSPAPPRAVIAFDPALTDADRDRILATRSSVSVKMPGKGRAVFREHKCFLRVLRLLMGDDGVAAVDENALKYWTRGALDDELTHDADVDIESMFMLHAVYDGDDGEADADRNVYWLHSHGLAELGFVDFDIIEPSAEFVSASGDPTRAIALAIVEGRLAPGQPPFPLCHPGGEVEPVEAAAFDRSAEARFVALRDAEGHTKRRVVLCDPRAGGWLSRLFSRRVRPARWMTEPVEGRRVVLFSNAATTLMADRARVTYSRMRQIAAELRELGIDLPVIVKLGYQVDGGESDDREHMWFEVHDAGEREIDATLMNEPFQIARMQAGERGKHSVDLLTEWAIMTPFGQINPRQTVALRMIRSDPELVRRMMEQHRRG